jgi:hypothetical protein
VDLEGFGNRLTADRKHIHPIHTRGGWPSAHRLDHAIDRRGVAGGEELDAAVRTVTYPSADPLPARRLSDVPPEPHALDAAACDDTDDLLVTAPSLT